MKILFAFLSEIIKFVKNLLSACFSLNPLLFPESEPNLHLFIFLSPSLLIIHALNHHRSQFQLIEVNENMPRIRVEPRNIRQWNVKLFHLFFHTSHFVLRNQFFLQVVAATLNLRIYKLKDYFLMFS